MGCTVFWVRLWVFGLLCSHGLVWASAALPNPPAIAWWRFTEFKWDGSPNEVVNEAQNRFHGRSYNNAQIEHQDAAIPGTRGTCRSARFDGSNYVDIDYTPDINPDNFTLAMWAKPDPNYRNRYRSPLTSRGETSGYDTFGYNVYAASNNYWQFWTSRGDTGAHGWDVVQGPPVRDGQWEHIAFSFEKTGNATAQTLLGTKKIYVNGVLVATAQNQRYRPMRYGVQAKFTIGAGGQSGSAFRFKGLIDEVFLYDRVLSPSEILTVRNAESNCGLAAAWHFDEPSWQSSPQVEEYTWLEAHGSARNGAQTASRRPARPGNPGTCGYAELDGQNDYIHLDNPAELNFSGEISLAAWVRVDEIGRGIQGLITHGPRWGPNQETGLRINHDRYQIMAWNGTDYIAELSIPPEDVGTGKWTHLVGTYDGQDWRLYRDGVLRVTRRLPVGALQVSANWSIGASSYGAHRYFKGAIDEPRIFKHAMRGSEVLELFNEVHDCPNYAPEITLRAQHDGQGVFYCPETVTVEALLAGGLLDNQFDGLVNLQAVQGPGFWRLLEGQGTLTPQAQSTHMQYQFSVQDRGRARFEWVYSGAASNHGFSLQSPTASVQSTAVADMNFAALGFQLNAINTAADNVKAGVPQTLQVTVQNADAARSACVTALDYQGNKSLNWRIHYQQPNTGSRLLLLEDQHQTWQRNIGGSDVSQMVNFSAGEARLRWSYTDVGRFDIRLSDPSAQVTSGVMAVQSRPHHLRLDVDNPDDTDPSDDRFAVAGEAFRTRLFSYAANGQLTPNFGLETPPSSASIRAQLHTPSAADGAALGILTNTSLSRSGSGQVGNNAVSYGDVGRISLLLHSLSLAGDPGTWLAEYLNDDVSQLSVSPSQRFVADRLQVSFPEVGTLGSICGGYSYVGETLPWQVVPSLLVSAHGRGGGLLQNYGLGRTPIRSGLLQLTPALQDALHKGRDGISALAVQASGFAAQFVERRNHALYFRLTGDYQYIQSLNAERAPFVAQLPIQLTTLRDEDGATLSTSNQQWAVQGSAVRMGRVRVHSGIRAWVNPEPLAISVEYFDGQKYTTSTTEACSRVLNLSVFDDDAGDGFDFDPATSNWATQILPNVGLSRSWSMGDGGVLNYQLPSKAREMRQAQVRLQAQVPAHLRYPWRGGAFIAPQGEVLFGVNGGPGDMHDGRIISIVEIP